MECLIFFDDVQSILGVYDYECYQNQIVCRNVEQFKQSIKHMLDDMRTNPEDVWTVSFDYNLGTRETGAHWLLWTLNKLLENGITKETMPYINFHTGDIDGREKMWNLLQAFTAIL